MYAEIGAQLVAREPLVRPPTLAAQTRPSEQTCGSDEWVRRIGGGGVVREQALVELRQLLVRGLGHALARHSAGHAEVEDFVQEALVKILDALADFRGEGRFVAWALRIAVRVAYSELRRRRWQDVSYEQMTSLPRSTPAAAGPASQDPERQAMQQRMLAALERAIAEALTERQRHALIAEYVHGVPLEEVARRLGATRNAVYKMLFDARQRLRRALTAAGWSSGEIASLVEAEGDPPCP